MTGIKIWQTNTIIHVKTRAWVAQ